MHVMSIDIHPSTDLVLIVVFVKLHEMAREEQLCKCV